MIQLLLIKTVPHFQLLPMSKLDQSLLRINELLCFCSVLCLLCLCARLFICALWSPARERADLLALVCGV